jgi:hypothetical protein
VEAIRALAGALLLGGYTKGIFVTTSHFQSGADRTVALASARGVPIELVDAQRFYDALGIVQREMYQYADESAAPFLNPDTSLDNDRNESALPGTGVSPLFLGMPVRCLKPPRP